MNQTNPIKQFYLDPPKRIPANGRVPAVGRVSAVGRKLADERVFDDEAVRVVLDTNVIIHALVAKRKGTTAEEIERDCLSIINLLEHDLFSTDLNTLLYNEYQSVGQREAKKGTIYSSDLFSVTELIRSKSFSHRDPIIKVHVSKSYKDDHLFDGLDADYLITEDVKDNLTPQVLSRQTCYDKIVTAKDFLSEMRTRGLLK